MLILHVCTSTMDIVMVGINHAVFYSLTAFNFSLQHVVTVLHVVVTQKPHAEVPPRLVLVNQATSSEQIVNVEVSDLIYFFKNKFIIYNLSLTL